MLNLVKRTIVTVAATSEVWPACDWKLRLVSRIGNRYGDVI